MTQLSHKNAHASQLFDGIANNYETPAQIFSFFQYRRWRKYLVSRLELTSRESALDICTGPGGVAAGISKKYRCSVTGFDLSREMLTHAKANVNARGLDVRLVQGRAESLPFKDNSFDAVTFTFLLRYVDNVDSTIAEMMRVLRPGGMLASLEFFTPSGLLYPPWLFHTRVVMPVGMFVSPGWRKVGTFLGPSISNFYKKNPLKSIGLAWEDAGIKQVHITKLSLGGAVVMWGRKRSI